MTDLIALTTNCVLFARRLMETKADPSDFILILAGANDASLSDEAYCQELLALALEEINGYNDDDP